VGASYDGWNQFLTALAKPPHLATIIPNVPDAGPFHNFRMNMASFSHTAHFPGWNLSARGGCDRIHPG